MVTITAEQKAGAVIRRLKVSAPSIERAIHIAASGADSARVVFPIDAEGFFAPRPGYPFTREGIAYEDMTP